MFIIILFRTQLFTSGIEYLVFCIDAYFLLYYWIRINNRCCFILLHCRGFLDTITSYCQLDHWAPGAFLNCFLTPLRNVYQDQHVTSIGVPLWINRRGLHELVTEDSVVNVICSVSVCSLVILCHSIILLGAAVHPISASRT